VTCQELLELMKLMFPSPEHFDLIINVTGKLYVYMIAKSTYKPLLFFVSEGASGKAGSDIGEAANASAQSTLTFARTGK
jgi:hypothetical protein